MYLRSMRFVALNIISGPNDGPNKEVEIEIIRKEEEEVERIIMANKTFGIKFNK